MKFILYILPAIVIFAGNTAMGNIRFVENKGQWENNILFRAEIPSGYFYIENNTLTYLFFDSDAINKMHHKNIPPGPVNCHAVKIHFRNANKNAYHYPLEAAPEYYNYFKGNDPSKWASGVNAYKTVFIKDLYPGIELEIVSLDEAIKFNFHVAPGVDPSIIQMEYEGADGLEIQEGKLVMQTTLATVTEKEPVSFQDRKNRTREIRTKYQLENNTLSFKTASYNRRLPLIIDPIVVFSTYSGSVADNFGFTATYDSLGNAYSGGTVYAPDFPTTTGAFQSFFQGGVNNPQMNELSRDAGILKFSPDGTQLLYATYLGGSHNEQPHSMVINKDGNLVIMGTTYSSNFPTSSNAFDRTYNGNGDIFIFILSNNGQNMISSTFIGGSGRDGYNGNPANATHSSSGPLAYNYGDYYRGEVIVDDDNNIYVATSTQSTPAMGFPALNGFNTVFSGSQSGVVIKLDSDLSNLLWSTFLNGSAEDAAYGITLSPSGDIYVTGGTRSNNFHVTPLAFQPVPGGGTDGFICRISPDGRQLIASTYFGTTDYDQSYFIQTDRAGRIYITGQSTGNRPVSPGVFSNIGATQFIAMFDENLTSLLKYTTFGPNSSVPNLSPSAFMVDICGRIYFSGWGGDVNNKYNSYTGMTQGFPLSDDAFQRTTNGSDFYLIILDKEMSSLVYGTYFGGNRSADHVDGGTSRFDKNGIVYQSVCASCGSHTSDFPTTPGAWSTVNKGRRPGENLQPGCNNAVFKIDLNSSNFPPEFRDTILYIALLDELIFNFHIIDKDPMDSIYFTWSGKIFDTAFNNPPAIITGNPGRSPVNGTLRFTPLCQSLSEDTLVVTLHIRDDGCPTPRTTTGTIKIVVEKPPVPDPPYVMCITRQDANTLAINWDEFELNRYISHYKLMKIHPDGTHEMLDSIISIDQTSYIDDKAFDHRNVDYCYFLYGVNVCGDIGDSTRIECSIPHKDSIPKASGIYTVTVENNRDIRIIWYKTPIDDFYSYRLYRRENTAGATFELYALIKSQTDTSFLDTNVNVHKQSYCYLLILNNQCKIESEDNDFGCSILLTGTSIPFQHHLNWSAYEKWRNGVNNYQIVRDDPLNPAAIIAQNTPPGLSHIDDKLNYDVGLYYYTIVAEESADKYPAISMSNTIELVQAPLLHVPNAFTPNHDSINDFWNIVPVFVKEFELKVFNRWGEHVYTSNHRNIKWDGLYKKDNAFDNVFIYLITFNGWDESVHYRKGNVTILE